MCACTYVSVKLRNVNLRSRSGTRASLIRALYEDVNGGWSWGRGGGGGGATFLGDGGWGGQRGWAFTMYEIGLVTLRKKKQRSHAVHCRSQESRRRTRQSSEVESTYWRVFTSQVLLIELPLNQQCTICDTCTVCPTNMRNAHRNIGTWHSAMHHMDVFSYLHH